MDSLLSLGSVNSIGDIVHTMLQKTEAGNDLLPFKKNKYIEIDTSKHPILADKVGLDIYARHRELLDLSEGFGLSGWRTESAIVASEDLSVFYRVCNEYSIGSGQYTGWYIVRSTNMANAVNAKPTATMVQSKTRLDGMDYSTAAISPNGQYFYCAIYSHENHTPQIFHSQNAGGVVNQSAANEFNNGYTIIDAIAVSNNDTKLLRVRTVDNNVALYNGFKTALGAFVKLTATGADLVKHQHIKAANNNNSKFVIFGDNSWQVTNDSGATFDAEKQVPAGYGHVSFSGDLSVIVAAQLTSELLLKVAISKDAGASWSYTQRIINYSEFAYLDDFEGESAIGSELPTLGVSDYDGKNACLVSPNGKTATINFSSYYVIHNESTTLIYCGAHLFVDLDTLKISALDNLFTESSSSNHRYKTVNRLLLDGVAITEIDGGHSSNQDYRIIQDIFDSNNVTKHLPKAFGTETQKIVADEVL